MTIKVKKFTPEVMLNAPRRSPAVPSPDGKLALYTQSTYSFESHSKTNEICVLDIASQEEVCVSKDSKASEPKWLGVGTELVWLKEGENGNTSFIVGDGTNVGKTYVAGTVAGPVSNLKLHLIKPGMIAVAVSGQSNPDGSLHSPKDESKSRSTARIYDSLFVRHWDAYVTVQKASIFTALLQKSTPKVTGRLGTYKLLGFTNAISRESKLESPIPTFGGTDHFDIGQKGLTFVAKDPDLNPATHTKCNLYFVPREDLMDVNTHEPIHIKFPNLHGAASQPTFSPDGSTIAFLKMRKDGYESDKNGVGTVTDFTGSSKPQVLALMENSSWDKSPSALMWSLDGKTLYAQAEDTGRGCLFKIDLAAAIVPGYSPEQLTTSGYITDVAPASATSSLLFVSGNSLIDNSIYYYIDPSSPDDPPSIASSLSKSGIKFGLSPSQVSELWWKGDEDRPIHAWMVRPSYFRADHKYPLAYLIHGGPQGAWNDQWSTRWNPAVFAEQGYIVVCPNPTGSTGYGQAFTDAIRNNWGGSPYIDLVKGFEYIEADLDFVDTSRAVALGASYGGYMMNWIQGHDLAKKFKALVCHDGVFSMTAQLASEEQYFPIHDLGGPIWERQEIYDKWDPSRFVGNWETPMLVIHNELDYRLTIAEGLSAFNVLQMRGIESRFLTFPDENHWVLKPENSLVWHTTVINWINHYCGLPKLLEKDELQVARKEPSLILR